LNSVARRIAKENHLVGDQFGSVVLHACLVSPPARLKPALDVHLLLPLLRCDLQISARAPQATTLNHSTSSRRSPSADVKLRLVATLKLVTGRPLGVKRIPDHVPGRR
jgi:hypothetical protein